MADSVSAHQPAPKPALSRELARVLIPVWTAGVVICAVALASALTHGAPAGWRLPVAAVLILIGEAPLLSVRLGSHQEIYTFGDAALIVGLLLLPASWLVLSEALLVFVLYLCLRSPAMKATFNGANAAIRTAAATSVAGLMGYHWDGSHFRVDMLPALLVATLTFSVVSELVVGAVISAAQQASFVDLLRSDIGLRLLNLLGNTAVGIGVVALARWSPVTLAVLPPVLIALLLIYRSSLRSTQEADAWQQLNTAADELSRLDEEFLSDAIVAHAQRLFRPDRAELLAGQTVPAVQPILAGNGHPSRRRRSRVEAILEGPDGPAGLLRLLWERPVHWTGHEQQVLEAYAHTAGSRLVTARLRAQAEEFANRMAHEAAHDPLTGLPNRRRLLERADEVLAEATGSGDVVGLLVLDLDGFKQVNDALGHVAGDRVLVEVGSRLARAVRRGDVVARLGGDEFAVLATGLASPDGATALAEQLVRILVQPVAFDALSLPVEGSIGVACFPQDGRSVGELLQRADVAMYQAKAERGSARRYRADLDSSSVDRLSLIAEMRPALSSGQLRVFYQPEIDLRTREIVRLEALARWDHPTRGLLAPADFLAPLEHSGLVHDFTLHMLDQAIRDCVQWRALMPSLEVAVNLSARTLLDPSLQGTVTELLNRYGLPPEALTLELTETAVTTDPVAAAATLARLHEAGVRLAVDDFGTGYSSLTLLSKVAVHELKIDRSFVEEMMTGSGSAIVRATVDLGHRLDLRVVAEGVERRDQLEALAGMGCDLAQGYHVARPMAPADMLAWLQVQSAEAAGGGGSGGSVLPMRRPRQDRP